MDGQFLKLEDPAKAEICIQIIHATILANRPLHLREVGSVAGLPAELCDDVQSLKELVELCGSFLTIRDEIVCFVHPEAKDYFITDKGSSFIPDDKAGEHGKIAHRLLSCMSGTLHMDMCRLTVPGALLKERMSDISLDHIIGIRYACCHWVDHLGRVDNVQLRQAYLVDGGEIHLFLQKYLLYWFEALSLLGQMSAGVLMVKQLQSLIDCNKSPSLFGLVHDANRFLLSNRSIIERAPLQAYCSGLLFSPKTSLIRRLFSELIPIWIRRGPPVEAQWNRLLFSLEGHSSSVSAVAFSSDGELVASGSWDKTIQLWEPATGAAIGVLEGHSGQITSVAFSPDGKLVASGSYDKTVRMWEATTGTAISVYKGHSDVISAVAFSPEGKLLASGSFDKKVQLWEVATGAKSHVLEGHLDGVSAVAFSLDGKLLASGSHDKTVRLWEVATGTGISVYEGHSNVVSAVAFSPDGKFLASGSYDNTVRQWEAATGTVISVYEGHSDAVCALAFSPEGNLLVSASRDKKVHLWEAGNAAAVGALGNHSDGVTAVAFSPDGKLVVSGSHDRTVRLWEAAPGPAASLLEGHSDVVSAVAFSLDGKLVASGSWDKTIQLWDTATGAAVGMLEGHSDWVIALAFSPDGSLVASGSWDKVIQLWDTVTGVAVCVLDGHSGGVTAVAFSPDGRLVVSGSHDRTVRLWDAATGALISLINVDSVIYHLSFTSDGQHLDSDTGIISLQPFLSYTAHAPSEPSHGLYVKDHWVTGDTGNLLWLPPDYRATCSTLRNNILVLGHSSGCVSFFEFDLANAPPARMVETTEAV